MRSSNKNGGVSDRAEQNNYTVRPKRRVSDEAPKGLSPRQLADLFRVIRDKRDEAIFRVMSCKALRASGVGLLELKDWNDRDGVLYVHRLKGSRSAPFPMHDRELRALRAWIKIRRPIPGPLFPSRQMLPISRSRIFELMLRYCKLAGIPPPLSHPHVLKHSRGTHLLDETGKILVVQDALGHKNIANTLIYAQVSNRERTDAVSLNRSKY